MLAGAMLDATHLKRLSPELYGAVQPRWQLVDTAHAEPARATTSAEPPGQVAALEPAAAPRRSDGVRPEPRLSA